MKIVRDKKGELILTLIIILVISLIFNIYQRLVVIDYSNYIKESMYENIEEIKVRNESILLTTNEVIESEVITNTQLLDLYNNYKTIYSVESETLEANLDYKNIENEVSQNNFFLRAEEYLKFLLISNTEGKLGENKEQVITKLNKDKKENITILRDVSEEINNYFIKLTETTLKGMEGKEKIEKLIEDDYWIEVVTEIQLIGDKYSEHMLEQ